MATCHFFLVLSYGRGFTNRKKASLRERSHKDGIQIGLNSAEALEEYFFKAVSQDSYVTDSALREYVLPEQDYRKYLDYHRVVCDNQDSIYLAKNNNFLLRYQSVRDLNPDFVMVIMFRHPLYHASSLLEKHAEYKTQQQEDPFILEYMNWLRHHEFGLNQKCFEFDGEDVPSGSKEDLDYWLQVWLNYYNKAISVTDKHSLFINYDDFCAEPNLNISRILSLVGMSPGSNSSEKFTNQRAVKAAIDSPLLTEAEELYSKLLSRS